MDPHLSAVLEARGSAGLSWEGAAPWGLGLVQSEGAPALGRDLWTSESLRKCTALGSPHAREDTPALPQSYQSRESNHIVSRFHHICTGEALKIRKKCQEKLLARLTSKAESPSSPCAAPWSYQAVKTHRDAVVRELPARKASRRERQRGSASLRQRVRRAPCPPKRSCCPLQALLPTASAISSAGKWLCFGTGALPSAQVRIPSLQLWRHRESGCGTQPRADSLVPLPGCPKDTEELLATRSGAQPARWLRGRALGARGTRHR